MTKGGRRSQPGRVAKSLSPSRFSPRSQADAAEVASRASPRRHRHPRRSPHPKRPRLRARGPEASAGTPRHGRHRFSMHLRGSRPRTRPEPRQLRSTPRSQRLCCSRTSSRYSVLPPALELSRRPINCASTDSASSIRIRTCRASSMLPAALRVS